MRRFDRTLDYFLTVAIADGRTAIEASEMLMKVHAKATGIEPLSGEPYSANDPASQLWIHVTGWQGVLLAYERYGPGRLTRRGRASLLARLRRRRRAPDLRPGRRPELARGGPRVLRRGPAAAADLADRDARRCATCCGRRWVENRSRLWLGSRLMAPATIATIPSWMRKEGGFDQPAARRPGDRAGRPAPRSASHRAGRVTQRILDRLVPRTAASYAHWNVGRRSGSATRP